MRHSRRRAETSSRGLDGRRNEFLEAPRDAPRTRPGEVARRRPRGAPDGARRKPWKVPAVTLDEQMREPPGHQRQAPRRPPPGGFRRPLGQSLGTRRHDRSEGSQPTPSIPPGRSSAEVRETLAEPLGGLPHDPPRGLAERLQELGHDPLRRPDRPPQQRPPPPSTEPSPTTSTRPLSTLRKGRIKTPLDNSTSPAHHPPRSLADHRNTHAQYAPKTVSEDPAEPLRELPHHPPQRPHRPPTRSLSTLRKGSSKDPAGPLRAPPPPSAEAP